MNYTKNFNQLSKDDAHIAGGKGASLGEMLQNNIPVPDGYVVTADTFDHFLEETGLTQKVTSILSTVNTNDIHTSEIASKQIQKLIKDAKMPEDIKKEIMSSFKKLDTKYVAVRSSATAEDGADHAWAGQLSSYLNTTDENLLEMVQNCWASLFTPRAIFYRFEKKLHDTHISVAVVVQKMVNSEKSGIAFSVHPVTEDHNQIIIEAGLGLGEAIVSGSVTPDSYVVSKNPQKIIDININTQNKALYRSDTLDDEHGFNEWKNLSEKQVNEQVLNEEQIIELSNIIVTVENHYGFPCDIEWAFENDKFYIVQSRPITTLKNKNKKDSVEVDEDNGVVKILERKQEQKGDILLKSFLEETDIQDIYPFNGSFSPLLTLVTWSDPDAGDLFKSSFPILMANKGRDTFAVISESKYKTSAIVVLEAVLNKETSIKDLKKSYEHLYNMANMQYESLVHINLSELDESFLVKKIKENRELLSGVIARTLFIETLDYNMIFEVCGDISDLELIWEHATCPYFESFESRRCGVINSKIVNSDILPEALSELMYIVTDYYQPQEKDEAKKQLLKMSESHSGKQIDRQEFNKWKNKLPNREKILVDYIQYIMEARDLRKDPIAKIQYNLFIIASELAHRSGIKPESVVMVAAQEYERGVKWLLNNKEKIESRKNGQIFLIHKNGALEQDSTEYFEFINKFMEMTGSINDVTNLLKGESASSGKATGKIRIILDAQNKDNIFNEGDILVTSMTRPEFVPLMKKAGAIVTNEGGITCHAAIVSRELNKPCVIGTKFATQVLKDGDLVEVDADNGVVKVLEKNSENKDLEKSIKDHRSEFFSYITKVKWNKNWAGEYSLIECCSYGLGYLKLLEKKWGIGLNSVLFSFKNGRSENYIVKKEVDILSKHVAKKLNNEEALINYIDDYEYATHNCLKYLEKHHIIKNFDDYSALIQIMNQFLVLNFPVKRFVDYLDLELSKKFLGIFGKIRVLGEPIYEKVQKMVTQYMKNISNQFEIERHLVSTLTLKELEALIVHNKKVSQKELEKRYEQCFLFINKNSNEVLFSQKEADKISQCLLNKGKQENTLFGQIAYKGKVKGKVKVIQNPQTVNLKNIKRPFILVTGMTRPEFLPFFEKSIAVVTDAGGVLSHAAITARELKKPCIIGTEFATQILKDGDLVEVDADNGVVKVLKKTN